MLGVTIMGVCRVTVVSTTRVETVEAEQQNPLKSLFPGRHVELSFQQAL